MHLSEDQESALEYVAHWLAGATPPGTEMRNGRLVTVGRSHDYPVCSVGGYAGTGKTTLLRSVADQFSGSVLVTPTHKAAQVLRAKLPPFLAARVQTFHSLIYTPDPEFTCEISGGFMTQLDCGCPGECDCELILEPCMMHEKADLCDVKEHLKFILRTHLSGYHDLIIVDEASMLTLQEVRDLRRFGLPVLLVGDHGQLPPVQAKMNPYILNPDVTLTVNHRQGETSGIPEAAEDARSYGALPKSSYGSSVRVLRAASQDAELLLGRVRPDAYETAVIVQYNKTRAALNLFFREQRGDAHSPIVPGERIISLERQEDVPVLRDGQAVNETMIFNGMMATVIRVIERGTRTTLVEAVLDADITGAQGTQVMLTLATEQLGKAEGLAYRQKPRYASLWDYAYAITAHKSQGSEFDKVIVWQESKGDRRWLYTAVTRARSALVVLT